jgi:hypothetical protein
MALRDKVLFHTVRGAGENNTSSRHNVKIHNLALGV